MSEASPGRLRALMQALQRLPGVGQRSAARMAYHLLQHDRDGALQLAQALQAAVQGVRHCALCHTLAEDELCPTCADPTRDATQLCVVETPADQAAIERTGVYRGRYFVLMGHLSPLDGIGPDDIGLRPLLQRLQTAPAVQEVIVATNFTAEGEATAHVVSQLARALGLRVTRLARGVPVGSELEYVDLGTIAHALADRH
ncbi:recombination mediator RecR [Tepidimonas sp.]|uniref:recombination mediator RecR n=1 Tax=Tepidimonas sp. TaxID=2002775 RepID=UPI002FE38FE1